MTIFISTFSRNCWRGLIHSNHQMDENLDLYYQLCSLELNTQMQTEMSACLANRGVHPISGKQVLPPRSVKKALTLMFSSGQFLFFKYWIWGTLKLVSVSHTLTCLFNGLVWISLLQSVSNDVMWYLRDVRLFWNFCISLWRSGQVGRVWCDNCCLSRGFGNDNLQPVAWIGKFFKHSWNGIHWPICEEISKSRIWH